MSEFEYTSLSSDDSSTEDIVCQPSMRKTKTDFNTMKVKRELRVYYSNLFIDSFNLIDSFVKSKKFTYNSFLEQFGIMNYHQIYIKPKNEKKQAQVSPHHYITTTQDALAIASKFLRSHSRKARIGAVYLLYTLYKTQPLKLYPIYVKMEPKDYSDTKKLVDECLKEGLLHPAYCFYDLDIRRKIIITAATISPCLEVNYPSAMVRKHMGRVADKYFDIEYEERSDIDPLNRFQLMEHQMRNELAYINKLSNLSLGHDATPEYKVVLSDVLVQINDAKYSTVVKQHQSDKNKCLKKTRYKNKNLVAFPGKNDNILEDMVITAESPNPSEQPHCHPRKKLRLSRKRKRDNKNKMLKTSALKDEPGTSSTIPKLSDILGSDSSSSSIESDDYTDNEDKYEKMIWGLLEGNDNNEFDKPSKSGEEIS